METPWHWLPSTVLEKCMSQFTGQAPFSTMGIALVDLTHAPPGSGYANLITYAGWRDQEQFYVASLAKIAIILAAHRLLACFRAAARQSKATDAEKLIKDVTDAWKPAVSRRIAGRPADFPKFERIFQIAGKAGAWTIDFDSTFHGHMVGIVENDNRSANYCIEAIGFQYINGTLIHEGLYDEQRKRGLWLGGGYSAKLTWGSSSRHHGATAAAVAKMLTLLHTGQLVGPDESFGMRGLFDMATESFAYFLTELHGRPVEESIGKIGYIKKGTDNEGAIITRKVGGKTLRYVAVGLNTPHGKDGLYRLIEKLDDCIVNRHIRP